MKRNGRAVRAPLLCAFAALTPLYGCSAVESLVYGGIPGMWMIAAVLLAGIVAGFAVYVTARALLFEPPASRRPRR